MLARRKGGVHIDVDGTALIYCKGILCASCANELVDIVDGCQCMKEIVIRNFTVARLNLLEESCEHLVAGTTDSCRTRYSWRWMVQHMMPSKMLSFGDVA
eukprot:4964882-Amphidinium_carterae.2